MEHVSQSRKNHPSKCIPVRGDVGSNVATRLRAKAGARAEERRERGSARLALLSAGRSAELEHERGRKPHRAHDLKPGGKAIFRYSSDLDSVCFRLSLQTPLDPGIIVSFVTADFPCGDAVQI